MAIATSNRLLPLLAAPVLLLLVFVSVRSCSGDDGRGPLLDHVPQAPAPDADTPADTIKTLTANVAAMTANVEALRRDNASLRKQNQSLIASRGQIEEQVMSRVQREVLAREQAQPPPASPDTGVLASLSARVDALADSLSKTRTSTPVSDIPVGLGLDGLSPDREETIQWIDPLDQASTDQDPSGLLSRAQKTAGGYLDTSQRKTRNAAQGVSEGLKRLQPTPVYTVPRNATLIGATAMTALVGRVPVQGQVRDPMPFKVITGADNLAANGLTVPGVQGMVWSGTAVGDWTLSCVSGRLESVTFVFDDGTIRTLSADDRQGQGGGANKPLGWISDDRGIPCISGERKSNAPAFLSQRIGAMALQAAAQAAAAAETTATVNEAGSASSTVTGNSGAYVLGKTLAGGSDELAKWLLERQAQSFDAVFVPAGTKVALHVDRELAIDLDPNGRRLSHANALSGARPGGLD